MMSGVFGLTQGEIQDSSFDFNFREMASNCFTRMRETDTHVAGVPSCEKGGGRNWWRLECWNGLPSREQLTALKGHCQAVLGSSLWLCDGGELGHREAQDQRDKRPETSQGVAAVASDVP